MALYSVRITASPRRWEMSHEAVCARRHVREAVAITDSVTTAHLKTEVANGLVMTASTTNEAPDALGLRIGRPTTAVVKSSDVIGDID